MAQKVALLLVTSALCYPSAAMRLSLEVAKMMPGTTANTKEQGTTATTKLPGTPATTNVCQMKSSDADSATLQVQFAMDRCAKATCNVYEFETYRETAIKPVTQHATKAGKKTLDVCSCDFQLDKDNRRKFIQFYKLPKEVCNPSLCWSRYEKMLLIPLKDKLGSGPTLQFECVPAATETILPTYEDVIQHSRTKGGETNKNDTILEPEAVLRSLIGLGVFLRDEDSALENKSNVDVNEDDNSGSLAAGDGTLNDSIDENTMNVDVSGTGDVQPVPESSNSAGANSNIKFADGTVLGKCISHSSRRIKGLGFTYTKQNSTCGDVCGNACNNDEERKVTLACYLPDESKFPSDGEAGICRFRHEKPCLRASLMQGGIDGCRFGTSCVLGDKLKWTCQKGTLFDECISHRSIRQSVMFTTVTLQDSSCGAVCGDACNNAKAPAKLGCYKRDSPDFPADGERGVCLFRNEKPCEPNLKKGNGDGCRSGTKCISGICKEEEEEEE